MSISWLIPRNCRIQNCGHPEAENLTAPSTGKLLVTKWDARVTFIVYASGGIGADGYAGLRNGWQACWSNELCTTGVYSMALTH